jgi:hypothetical protein
MILFGSWLLIIKWVRGKGLEVRGTSSLNHSRYRDEVVFTAAVFGFLSIPMAIPFSMAKGGKPGVLRCSLPEGNLVGMGKESIPGRQEDSR